MPSTIQVVTEDAPIMTANGKKVLRDAVSRATCKHPNLDSIRDPKKPLAVDAEFQNYRVKGEPKFKHRIGRVALVKTCGETMYDVYANYGFDSNVEVKLRPKRLGFNVTWRDLAQRNGAKESWKVLDDLYHIMHGRVIVGHGMQHDITALEDAWENVSHAKYDIQSYYGQRALGTVAADNLTESFDWHNPVDDARATILPYLRIHPYNKRDSFKNDFAINKDDAAEFPTLAVAATIKK